MGKSADVEVWRDVWVSYSENNITFPCVYNESVRPSLVEWFNTILQAIDLDLLVVVTLLQTKSRNRRRLLLSLPFAKSALVDLGGPKTVFGLIQNHIIRNLSLKTLDVK